MKAKIITLLVAALLLALMGEAAASAATLPNVIGLSHEYFSPSDANICNPERGIFHHIGINSSNSSYRISKSYMSQCRNNGISLLFIAFIMRDFRDGDISDEYLTCVRSNLEGLRAGGMKAVIRFSYTYDVDDMPHDVPPALAYRHIEQLTPILRDCSDVIALVEAGFVGTWGEWYYTDNWVFQPNYRDYGLRAELVNHLAEALPADRFISLRYPAAKLGVLQITYLDTISAETAYDGSLRSRIGFHNDCFLANNDDMGTFNHNGNFRTYWKWESRFSPMGGETCTEANSFSEVANARQDFQAYHWSYLNEDYHRGMLQSWEDSGFMPEIRRSLGYRFVLTDSHVTPNPRAGEPMRLVVRLANKGWAAPFNPRPLYVVLKNVADPSQRFAIPLNSTADPTGDYSRNFDPRFWLAGDDVCLDATFILPPEVPEGSYQVCLWLPDPAENLAEKSEFAIRFANAEDVWLPADGGLNVLHTVDVQGFAGIEAIKDDASSTGSVFDGAVDLLGRPASSATTPPGTIIITTSGSKHFIK